MREEKGCAITVAPSKSIAYQAVSTPKRPEKMLKTHREWSCDLLSVKQNTVDKRVFMIVFWVLIGKNCLSSYQNKSN